MKLFKYGLCICLIFCGCGEEKAKEKIPELACPYVLPAEKDFPVSWITIGKIPPGKLQLRETSIIDGNAAAEKERISSSGERIFSVDMYDEWEYFQDRSESRGIYDEDHTEMSIMCTYGRTRMESYDINLNVLLLIPLPAKKPLDCLMTRRDLDPTHELSCEVK